MIVVRRVQVRKEGGCNGCNYEGEFVSEIRISPTTNFTNVVRLCNSCRDKLLKEFANEQVANTEIT